tara:strand:- start:445 stop:906 length:462 start_codon:yes stop_codon:yes gene_type:complete
MLHFFKDIQSLWYLDIVRRNKKTPFLVFISFLITYVIARSLATFFATISVIIREFHIHHFYYGFVLLVLSAWVALVSEKDSMKKMSALFLGVGAGLVVDEIGLLLTCTTPALNICDYYARGSYDIFILITGLLLLILYSGPVYRFLKRTILRR